MKTDYPELEGKEIEFHTNYGIINCIVVGVNYHVGITVVNKKDKDDACICLSYKLHKKETYRKHFHHYVKCIQKGSFTEEDHNIDDKIEDKIEDKAGGFILIENCPWR